MALEFTLRVFTDNTLTNQEWQYAIVLFFALEIYSSFSALNSQINSFIYIVTELFYKDRIFFLLLHIN